ncbi:M48 family metalloprotease [Rubripirellula reticaptiva]|uniref:Peptidase M48 domain-containing protein n=1 Tax=Rubripirellula reticaptiva TaxID=2528013 RepID=A0A5C6EKA4_9BACT|nr:hypothetical protein [Rubripirellula reticaptiva]TWU49512.1 hypothetical protein Poly59_41270 [Rubripirellula reticaptiva]
MMGAGYDPDAMIELLNSLMQAGGRAGPEFLQSHPHPHPAKRQEALWELIERAVENGRGNGSLKWYASCY